MSNLIAKWNKVSKKSVLFDEEVLVYIQGAGDYPKFYLGIFRKSECNGDVWFNYSDKCESLFYDQWKVVGLHHWMEIPELPDIRSDT